MARMTVFDELERAWANDRKAWRAVGEWADSPLLADRTPMELTVLAHEGSDRERTEAALAALICRVGDDELAGQTVMHMLLPAAKRLTARLALDGDAAERALMVVGALWGRIRTYPWQRRPGRVSGNVLADVVMVTTRSQRQRSAPVVVWLDDIWVDGDDDEGWLSAKGWLVAQVTPSAGEELLSVLADAVGDGVLDRDTARLIGQCRFGSIPADVLGAERGIGAQGVRRRRQRGEARLVNAMAA